MDYPALAAVASTLNSLRQVSLSSLNRHAVATRADVGIPKAECLRKHFASIFPECQIEVKVLLYDTSSEEEILSRNPDYVLDCIDKIDTKVALLAACVRRGVKVLSATGAGSRTDPTRIRVADLRESTNDPLSRAVKYRLKKDHGIERGIPVVFSLEKPKVKLLPFKGPTGEDENPSDYQVKVKKRLTESVLSERIKKLDDQQADGIFCGSRPIATPSERLREGEVHCCFHDLA